MGFSLPTLRYIAREHKHHPLPCPVLTLGRQCVYATFDEVISMLTQEGITTHPLPKDFSHQTNIRDWKNTAYKNNISDTAFFYLLTGQASQSLDISDYEDAEYIWDLNKPISKDWQGKFGTIIDSGTLEHLFDVRQSMANIVHLLQPHGRIIHISPANNYMEHGFYQFSPTFFYDYYGSNAFSNLRCFIAEQPVAKLERGKWNFWQWSEKRPYLRLTSRHMLAIYFSAQKTPASGANTIPQQGDFLKNADKGKTNVRKLPAWQENIYTKTPRWIIVAGKRILGIDKTVKPWGLRYRGKL